MSAGAYYPIFIRVEDCPVLVVGGGELAEHKAQAMLDHAARVTLVSPAATPRVQEWAGEGRLQWRRRGFEDGDVDGCRLVFCASDEPELNRRVSQAAQHRGIPVNVVDVPELCSFIVPSILRRGHLAVAVSTDGRCPSFSRHVRQELESVIDDSFGQALELLEQVRAQVHELFRERDYDARRRVMETVLALDIPKIIRSQGIEAASRAAHAAVRRSAAGDAA